MTESTLPIFPPPRSCQLASGEVRLNRGIRWAQAPGRDLEPEWWEGLVLPPEANTAAALLLHLESDSDFAPEEYRLRLNPSEVRIRAGGRTGFFYALSTLRQLSRAEGPLPTLELQDKPALQVRGIMLDISRTKVPTLDALRHRIEILGHLRYNQLQLYTEHTFAFSQHPKVWQDASPLTAEDYRILQEACRTWCIELVPNLNSFGHMERWLKHPEYHTLAEHPQAFTNQWGTHHPNGTTLKPDQQSADFMESLYEEFLPLFESRYFHLGGDETWELGKGWSKQLVEKEGLGPVYCSHLQRLAQKVETCGKIPQFWADIVINHPESIADIPRPSIPVLWGYEAGHPFEEEATKIVQTGLPFLIAPGTASWLSLGTRGANVRQNIRQAVQCAKQFGAIGTLLTDWGDRGHHQFWVSSWIPVFQMAGAAWSGELPEDAILHRALPQFLQWADTEPDWADILFQISALDGHFTRARHNWSPLYELLVADPATLRKLAGEIPSAELLAAGESIAALLARANPGQADPCAQVTLTLKLLEIAVRRGLGSARAEDLESLIPTYAEVRLRESRPGGLEESLGYLYQVADWMPNA